MGIVGNETANYGAKTTLAILNKGMLTDIYLGINEVRKHYINSQINKWQEDWDQTPNIWHYNIKPTVNSKRPDSKNPIIDKIITKLQLGASNQLNTNKHTIKKKDQHIPNVAPGKI